jgi:hypothetical protein
MRPALDSAGHRVPRTKPTCLLHTWRPHRRRPFRTCSSPAQTPVKPQPAPTILSQDLVHTTFSITHHTRKQPSTGPRTTHGPETPCSYAQRSGCLYTSFNQDHDSMFFSFLEQKTTHAVCFNARGLLYECVFDTLLFFSSYRPVGKPISHHVLTQPSFFLLFFFGPSYRPSCLPRCSDTTHECIFDAL